MPMVSYDAAEGRLHVMMENLAVPQLTPLAMSNPGDSFDASHPWFNALDPSREGRSFSRRYGFGMDAMSDLLPAGRTMWIRRVAATPGLGAYAYSSTAPGRFEPILGTDGVPTEYSWNGMMFHPLFTALPGSGDHSMTLELYLVETSTGMEVPGSSTGQFVLKWTNTAGPFELSISVRTIVFFPLSSTNSVLEGTHSLTGGDWTTVTNEIVLLEGKAASVLEPTSAHRFFRLTSSP